MFSVQVSSYSDYCASTMVIIQVTTVVSVQVQCFVYK